MDEAGIMEGLGENGLVVGSAEKRSVQKKTPGSRVWTSFIECVSAAGTFLPPPVIFKGKSVQQQWFPEDLSTFSDWQFTATKNGWTSDQTAVEWLEKVFIPRTQPPDPSERRLLVGFLSLLTDSSPVGKQNFLSCYQKAREQALTVSNIKGGWKATDCVVDPEALARSEGSGTGNTIGGRQAEKKEEGGHEPEFEVRQY
ncbi:DDE superfamily endonuclease [Hirsutella rhossiliensis]